MAVVECGDQLQCFRKQHAVTKNVAGHVTDARDRDRFFLHVDTHFGEMALDRKPTTLGGDAHRLMVISNRAATGKSIAQPEIAFQRDGICGVGKCCCALVSGNNEIRIIPVMDNDIVGMHDTVVDDIVGNRQQGADEYFIGFGAFCKPGITVDAHIGQPLGIKSALGTCRHDHGVFHALRLHQA